MAVQRPQRLLLDVATGTGDVALEASKSLRTYAHIYAVDLSGAMLERAWQKAQKKNRDITFQKADGRDLPFSAAHFHCVSISFGLRNIQGVERALREFHRVLKPGGTLLILEFFSPPPAFLGSWFFRFYFRRILPAVAGLFSHKKDYAYLPRSVEQFYDVRALKQLAGMVGFTFQREHGFLLGSGKLLMFSRSEDAGEPARRCTSRAKKATIS